MQRNSSSPTWNNEIKQEDVLFPNAQDKSKSLSMLEKLCEDIRHVVDDIQTTAENLIEDASIGDAALGDLFQSLEQTALELEGTGRILESTH